MFKNIFKKTKNLKFRNFCDISKIIYMYTIYILHK